MAEHHSTTPTSSIWNRRAHEKSAFLASAGVGPLESSSSSSTPSTTANTDKRAANNDHHYSQHPNHQHFHGHSHNDHNANGSHRPHRGDGHHHNHNNNHHNHHNNHNNNHHNRSRNGNHSFQPDEISASGQRIVKPRVGTNVLENSWTVWFLHRGPGFKISHYLLATKQVGTFSTVEEFWDLYSHLRRIDKLPFTSEFQIFKKNVKPMWEDPANAEGGKWVVRLKRPSKGKKTEEEENIPDEEAAKVAAEKNIQHVKCRQQAAKYWEQLLLNLTGGSLIEDSESSSNLINEVMGMVISARRDEDIISVWTRQGHDMEVNEKIRVQIQRVLQLPEDFEFEYKIHQESIQEGAKKLAMYKQQSELATTTPSITSPTAPVVPRRYNIDVAAVGSPVTKQQQPSTSSLSSSSAKPVISPW